MAKANHYFAVFVHRLITTTCYLTVQDRKPTQAKVERWGADTTGAQRVVIEKISNEVCSMLERLKESPGHRVAWLKRPTDET